MIRLSLLLALIVSLAPLTAVAQSPQQLSRWLKRFPAADTNGDGKLSLEEAKEFRKKMLSDRTPQQRGGVPRTFRVDPGWDAERFPEHAICYLEPKEIAAKYSEVLKGRGKAVVSYEKPTDGSLRIVGTGHSFMAPGYKTFPMIAQAAGLAQPPLVTHTGGGMTGSARYKWEQENGIFQFDGKPTPKLLASISGASWDAMMFGPYYQDRKEYYACWIDFCLKYNPKMKFYISDAWPQLEQLDPEPTTEKEISADDFVRMGKEKYEVFGSVIESLNETYPNKVFVLPTSDAMVLAAQHYFRGELPGVEGIHKVLTGKERSLWRDHLGHLGTGFGNLEGYVFYATMYGKSPEKLPPGKPFGSTTDSYPSVALDQVFRKIAWQATINNPLSGVVDKNGDGLAD